MADADRLKQLFSNVLENALRYVHTPGVLKIFSELKAGRLFLTLRIPAPGFRRRPSSAYLTGSTGWIRREAGLREAAASVWQSVRVSWRGLAGRLKHRMRPAGA